MAEYKHARVTETIPQADGTSLVDTKSYHDVLSSHRVEVMEHFKTNSTRYLTDIISCMSVIREKRLYDMSIHVEFDENYQPRLLTRTIMLTKSNFKKTERGR